MLDAEPPYSRKITIEDNRWCAKAQMSRFCHEVAFLKTASQRPAMDTEKRKAAPLPMTTKMAKPREAGNEQEIDRCWTVLT